MSSTRPNHFLNCARQDLGFQEDRPEAKSKVPPAKLLLCTLQLGSTINPYTMPMPYTIPCATLERGQIWQLLSCVMPERSCADRFPLPTVLHDLPLKGKQIV